MGSPEFALPTLQILVDNYRVVGVVTQPDRPAGRGRSLTSPPVKTLAQSLDIPVVQPPLLRKDTEAKQQIMDWEPGVIVVTAYGQILRPDILDLPQYGALNVHASLLPRWRGAAPIQAAILHGDGETGATIMRMDPGMDTGPILSRRAISITATDTAGSLSPKLAQLGADLLIETLPTYFAGELQPQPQDDSQATYAPLLKKSDGELDFTQTADELARRVRAYHPWPGTYMYWQDKTLKIHQARPIEVSPVGPGVTTVQDGWPVIGTGEGCLLLEEVQPAGKKSMSGEAFLRGAQNWNIK